MYIIKLVLLGILDRECEVVGGMCFKRFLVIPHGESLTLFSSVISLDCSTFQPLTRTIIASGMLLAVSKVHLNYNSSNDKFMNLLNQQSAVKMKSSRTQVFSVSFCGDIFIVLTFTFRFVPVVVKSLMHLHVSCLHINIFRGQFCNAHVSLTEGTIFSLRFLPPMISSKSLARIGSYAHVFPPKGG